MGAPSEYLGPDKVTIPALVKLFEGVREVYDISESRFLVSGDLSKIKVEIHADKNCISLFTLCPLAASKKYLDYLVWVNILNSKCHLARFYLGKYSDDEGLSLFLDYYLSYSAGLLTEQVLHAARVLEYLLVLAISEEEIAIPKYEPGQISQ